MPKLTQAGTESKSFKPYELAKNEDYMNDAQCGHFHNILDRWKSELMSEVDRTVDRMKDVDHFSDILDRASQEEELALELRTRDRERKLIRKIEEAKERLEQKDYGFCEDCGADIGIKRLEARPTAQQCIDCKTFDEMREKQIRA